MSSQSSPLIAPRPRRRRVGERHGRKHAQRIDSRGLREPRPGKSGSRAMTTAGGERFHRKAPRPCSAGSRLACSPECSNQNWLELLEARFPQPVDRCLVASALPSEVDLTAAVERDGLDDPPDLGG